MSHWEYRNKLESSIGSQLEEANIPFQYEVRVFEFTIPAKERTYLTDFSIRLDNGKVFHIETKGRLSPDDRRKYIAVKEQNPDIDLRFVFEKDNKLNKGGIHRYTDWARWKGFKYAVKTIPPEWFEEDNENG